MYKFYAATGLASIGLFAAVLFLPLENIDLFARLGDGARTRAIQLIQQDPHTAAKAFDGAMRACLTDYEFSETVDNSILAMTRKTITKSGASTNDANGFVEAISLNVEVDLSRLFEKNIQDRADLAAKVADTNHFKGTRKPRATDISLGPMTLISPEEAKKMDPAQFAKLQKAWDQAEKARGETKSLSAMRKEIKLNIDSIGDCAITTVGENMNKG